MRLRELVCVCALVGLAACSQSPSPGADEGRAGESAAGPASAAEARAPAPEAVEVERVGRIAPVEGERHLANLRQLTFGVENAEAYFNGDGTELVFQASPPGVECDRIYLMRADGTDVRRISSGEGVTTCAYVHPHTGDIYYASTHVGGAACPPKPDFSQGYVWPVHAAYDIFVQPAEGGDLVRLTETPGYDAEATISPDGSMVVFTSARDGDLELYIMDPDGSNQRRVTDVPGYDGGAFFSPDSRRLVFRASRPTGDALDEFHRLLSQGLVRPSRLEIFTCAVDGSDMRQVTDNGAANFCPYFHPDGKRIIFASNFHDPDGRNFDLFLINEDGSGLEQITFNPTFDGFPMFSPDGRRLVFASNRHNARPGETNIFIADWVE